MKNTQFFYHNGKLQTVKVGSDIRSILRSDDIPLAERTVDHHTALLLADQNSSVLESNGGANVKRVSYAAYGHSKTALLNAGLAAFNSEWLDPTSESYFLGNGYRTFSSTLMRFLSADNLSPFGGGGLNAYCYCLGDPINFSDPSGHMRRSTRPPMPVPAEHRATRVQEIKEIMAANMKKRELAKSTIKQIKQQIANTQRELGGVEQKFGTGQYRNSSTTPEITKAAKQQETLLMEEISSLQHIISDQEAYKKKLYNNTEALFEEFTLYKSAYEEEASRLPDAIQGKVLATRQGN